MGSGSSANANARYSVTVAEVKPTTPEVTIPEPEQDEEIVAHGEAACRWHLKNCNPGQVIWVNSIREACPFNESSRVVKTCSGKRHSTASVIDIMRKASCDVCGKHIVDINGQTPFLCCVGCRDHGRKLHVCTSCHESGALSRVAMTPKHSKKVHRRSNNSLHPGDLPKRGSRGASRGLSPTPSIDSDCEGSSRANSRSSSRATSKNSTREPSKSSSPKAGEPSTDPPVMKMTSMEREVLRNASGKLMSGTWQATLTEVKQSRCEARDLKFGKQGALTGRGLDGRGVKICDVEGTYNASKAEWRESYAWGTLAVTVKANYHAQMGNDAVISYTAPVTLEGKFEASDGGHGQISLACP